MSILLMTEVEEDCIGCFLLNDVNKSGSLSIALHVETFERDKRLLRVTNEECELLS